MRKFICFMIIAATLTTIGCAKDSASVPISETESNTTVPAENDSEAGVLGLEMDFEGRILRVVTSDEYAYQIYSEELTGEVTNDAVYNRNLKLCDRYNFKIESLINNANKFDWYTPIINTVLSGEDAYDLVGHYAYDAYKAIVQGVYKNWLDIPYIDLENRCWNKIINDSATINNKLYAITGSLSTSVMQSAYAVFYNNDLAAEYGFTPESLYSTVVDGKWTIDYFNEITRDMYKDLDGDGFRSSSDRYGYAVMPDTAPDIWLAAFDQKLTSKQSDGTVKIELNTEKTASALEKLLDMFYNNEGVINLETIMPYESYYGDIFFANGNSVFTTSCLSAAYNTFRESAHSYGILTIPKWDEAQQNYYTHIMDKYTIWGIPVTAKDDEFIGFVTQALCEESLASVYPAFYDVALKQKYSTDEMTAEIVDMIIEGATFDFAFMFGEYCGKIQTLIREHIRNNDPDLASDLASRVMRLDKLAEAYK